MVEPTKNIFSLKFIRSQALIIDSIDFVKNLAIAVIASMPLSLIKD